MGKVRCGTCFSMVFSMTDETMKSFSWRAHPAKERLTHTTVALVVILAFAALAYLAFGSPGWAGLSIVVLVLALNRFFFPSRYTIDEEGITANYPLRKVRMLWKDLRRFVHDRHGGYLSTRARKSRLDAYQGMHILFDDQRDRIIECIDRLMARGRPA